MGHPPQHGTSRADQEAIAAPDRKEHAMNLKSLPVASMIVVSERWLTGDSRKVIDGLTLCRAMLGKLEEVHTGLITIQPQRSALTEGFKSARDAANRADDTFDLRGRGLFLGLQALECLSEDPDATAAFAAAREAIFPKGLSVLTLTYVQEVGEARLAKERLTPELRTPLEAVSIGAFTAAQAFDRWLSAADDLEAKLQARDAAQDALQGAADTVTLALAQEAKRAWGRVVRAFLNNLDLDDADAATRDGLLKTLRQEVASAARAAKSAQGEGSAAEAVPSTAPPADAAS
jgi:hypothetical protein